MITKVPPPPKDATEIIWLEIVHEVLKYNSDEVLEWVTENSWALWYSLHGTEKRDDETAHQEFAIKYWQLAQIARIAVSIHKVDSDLTLTQRTIDKWFNILDVRKFFCLDEAIGNLKTTVVFLREMAVFDKDDTTEFARFSYLFNENSVFNAGDCIASAPWERRIGLPVTKVFPVIQLLRIIASNDFQSMYPTNYSKVKGAILPVDIWIDKSDEVISKYRNDFHITKEDVNSFIEMNSLVTGSFQDPQIEKPFSINPLLEKPFVILENGTILLPIIPFLHNVATEGLYYRWSDDPDYGTKGRIHKNGIQQALGHRFAAYTKEQLGIVTGDVTLCWTDHCDCSRTHGEQGADFVIYSKDKRSGDSWELIIETKSKRFSSSFLANLLADWPRTLSELDQEKINEIICHPIRQINDRFDENPTPNALGLIVFLKPLHGANTLINNETFKTILALPKPKIPIYVVSSNELGLIISMSDFQTIIEFLNRITSDEIWRQTEFLLGHEHHKGVHLQHNPNKLCSGIHNCDHENPCSERFPCVYLSDNPVLESEIRKLHLTVLS